MRFLCSTHCTVAITIGCISATQPAFGRQQTYDGEKEKASLAESRSVGESENSFGECNNAPYSLRHVME